MRLLDLTTGYTIGIRKNNKMLELYLSTIIYYFLLALVIGFLIGWGTLTQKIEKGKPFSFFYIFIFKNFKLTIVFEWIFGLFAKILKALTGIDIDPPAAK